MERNCAKGKKGGVTLWEARDMTCSSSVLENLEVREQGTGRLFPGDSILFVLNIYIYISIYITIYIYIDIYIVYIYIVYIYIYIHS